MPAAPLPILLITRPAPAARRFAADAAARFPGRFRALIAPLIEIRPRPVPAPPPGTDALIFTSENAVAVFAKAHPGRSLPAFCVGARTGDVARAAGFSARAAAGTGADLAAAIAADLPTGTRLFHPRGAHKAGDLPAALAASGIAVTDAVVYDQAAVPLSAEARTALHGPAPVVVPLFSPRSARLMAAALPDDLRRRPLAICLSPAVAGEWPTGWPAVTADRPEAAALLDALGRAL